MQRCGNAGRPRRGPKQRARTAGPCARPGRGQAAVARHSAFTVQAVSLEDAYLELVGEGAAVR